MGLICWACTWVVGFKQPAELIYAKELPVALPVIQVELRLITSLPAITAKEICISAFRLDACMEWVVWCMTRMIGYCFGLLVHLSHCDIDWMKQTTVATSVTRILLGGGVSVSDTYRIRIRPGYTSDTFLAVSWKNGYVFAWIRVSDTFGPDGIQPKAVISPPKYCFGSKRWIDTKWWTCCNRIVELDEQQLKNPLWNQLCF